jgi:hypothetical protein
VKLDLVFPLIDLPDTGNADWYQAAADMMLASAKLAFKNHDVRYVQMTDEASKVVDGIDIRFTPTPKCEREELAQYRGHCTAEWALYTDRPSILCDVDLLWNNGSITQLIEPSDKMPDIVLFSRPNNSFQPFNGGLILTQPGQKQFWETYRGMMRVLPNDCKGWWGDQIALGMMTGVPQPSQNAVKSFGSSVAFLPIDLVAPSPKTQPSALLNTAAVHWKGGGKRKPWMPDYFKLLQSFHATEEGQPHQKENRYA